MAAPAVQDLNTLITTLDQGTKAQRDQINQQIAQNDQSGQAQVTGINAQKDQAFQDITQGAQNKGMFFSGFSPDQQAKYTAATYLPALAALQSKIAETRGNLLSQNANLSANVFNKAFDTQQGQVQAANQWNSAEDQRNFEKAQTEASQRFQTAQDEVNHLWQSGENDKARVAEAKLAADKIAADKELTKMQIAGSATKSSNPTPYQQTQIDKQAYDKFVPGATNVLKAVSPDTWLDANEASRAYTQILQLTGGDAKTAQQLFVDAMARAGKQQYGNYSL